MADATDRQPEIDAITEAFQRCVDDAFTKMAQQVTAAGPGDYYAAITAARRARDVALEFANRPLPTNNGGN
jgi:hypothetical protein